MCDLSPLDMKMRVKDLERQAVTTPLPRASRQWNLSGIAAVGAAIRTSLRRLAAAGASWRVARQA